MAYNTQTQILRQSQSKLALEFVNSHGITVTMEELLRITDVLVDTCLDEPDDTLKQRIKKLDSWIADKKTKQKNEQESGKTVLG